MTEEQKDAIVKAAKEMVGFWTGNDIMYMKCPQNLIDAVRAAEQPRWTVTEDFGRTRDLWDGTRCVCCALIGTPLYDSLPRIARLLNEDDARGGK